MELKTYSKNIASLVNAFLTEDDWHFSFDEQRGLFKFVVGMKGKLKKLNYIVDVKQNEFVVYAISPIGADADDECTMSRMADFVCRANYGLKNGNFELDMRDGEIRYKCFVDCDGINPSTEMIKTSIYCPAAMFEKYGEGIVGIIMNDDTAKEAISKCEKSPIEELRDLLGDEATSDDDMETMLARLAAKFGTDEELSATDTHAQNTETHPKVTTNLFASEGGVA